MGNTQLGTQRGGGGGGEGENAQGGGGFLGAIPRILFQIMMMQFVFNFFGKNSNSQNQVDSNGNIVPPLLNFFQPEMPFDVYVHLSNKNSKNWYELNRTADLVWFLQDEKYVYDQFSSSKYFNISLNISDSFINKNESMFLITTVVPHSSYYSNETPQYNADDSVGNEKKEGKGGLDINRKNVKNLLTIDATKDLNIIVSSVNLIEWMKPFTNSDLVSLLGDHNKEYIDHEATKLQEKDNSTVDIARHLKTRFDIGLVFDTTKHLPQSLSQEPFKSNIRIFPLEGFYHPILDVSDFWMIENDFLLLNDTLINKNVNIRLSYSVVSTWSWMIKKQLKQSMENQSSFGFYSRKETFMFKKIILNTNIYMLIFSAIFMVLHSIFSFFAFKNDVQFWYNNESMQGLSVLSVIFSFACELIVGLYLYDSENTSWLILFEIFIGIVLSAWKVTKAIKVTFLRTFPFFKFADAKNYKESNTKKYDEVAIKYMSIALMPCVVGYAIYSLHYYKYKSWYSYIISVLAGTVYTFGFIMMTPQLYINYKLKSVDHLPWRALIYRSLNTFVDDIASFLIEMPMLHRLSCFRDDIIFILYLYQRWIYRVDTRRQWGRENVETDERITETSETRTELLQDEKQEDTCNVMKEDKQFENNNIRNRKATEKQKEKEEEKEEKKNA